ncbi:periplasmic heavy metal sensor [Rhodospirillum centenum]|uniref:Periplasmic heavy metal sensor n=1 Tax=Rhodospirillum centenum (strain ATCC 51521 / SW) TaxID=414684 RepID=B6ISF4_RHOCS|nr:periplasmic heavy metal sensor [Rhodospirillum centenum]ACI98390.1 hypothetical protein RC1_0966 [Rhodospirillum centenum SW]
MTRTTLILSILLAVSLCINLLIAGIAIGHAVGRDDRPGWDGPSVLQFMGPGATLIPEETAGNVLARLRRESAGDRGHFFSEIRKAREEVRSALAARPFDPAAADAAFTSVRQATAAMQQRLQEAVVRTMAEEQARGTLPPPPPPKERRSSGRERPDRDRGGPERHGPDRPGPDRPGPDRPGPDGPGPARPAPGGPEPEGGR